MAICYKKLRKLLIDKVMNKTDLRRVSGISLSTLANSERMKESVQPR